MDTEPRREARDYNVVADGVKGSREMKKSTKARYVLLSYCIDEMVVNVQQSSFSRMMFTVGRLVMIKQFVGSEVINEAGFNNAFY